MENRSLDEAWNLIGEACYAYEDKLVRVALMLVRGDVAEKTILLQELKERHINEKVSTL